jgi:hypothetical protein
MFGVQHPLTVTPLHLLTDQGDTVARCGARERVSVSSLAGVLPKLTRPVLPNDVLHSFPLCERCLHR